MAVLGRYAKEVRSTTEEQRDRTTEGNTESMAEAANQTEVQTMTKTERTKQFWLNEWSGESHREIKEILGVSLGTVQAGKDQAREEGWTDLQEAGGENIEHTITEEYTEHGARDVRYTEPIENIEFVNNAFRTITERCTCSCGMEFDTVSDALHHAKETYQ